MKREPMANSEEPKELGPWLLALDLSVKQDRKPVFFFEHELCTSENEKIAEFLIKLFFSTSSVASAVSVFWLRLSRAVLCGSLLFGQVNHGCREIPTRARDHF